MKKASETSKTSTASDDEPVLDKVFLALYYSLAIFLKAICCFPVTHKHRNYSSGRFVASSTSMINRSEVNLEQKNAPRELVESEKNEDLINKTLSEIIAKRTEVCNDVEVDSMCNKNKLKPKLKKLLARHSDLPAKVCDFTAKRYRRISFLKLKQSLKKNFENSAVEIKTKRERQVNGNVLVYHKNVEEYSFITSPYIVSGDGPR